MHWADRIAKEIIASGKFKPYWVDDMKTPSGFAHIGSMLGPIIHSCIYRALKDAGHDAILTYVFNDFDVADEFPPNLKEQYKEHAGKVLKMIPSPDHNFKNLADYLVDDLKKSVESIGFEGRYLSSWEMYHQGKFDKVIKHALDNSEQIQDIYKKVSGSAKKEKGWLPFQVICEKCQKLGTTRVFAWDGKEVSYKCEPNLVTWAQGCGHEGEISPFGGNGKLPWKVDWAAHWKVIGVTIEGAGKDHASAGGSYDIAMTICKDIFGYERPYRLPYEFILIGGKKMSSSKGLGLKAHDLVKILPPSIARFLFVSKDIESQSNFDPIGTMAIPDLFDEYDKAWEAYDKGGDEKLARTYELSQVEWEKACPQPPERSDGRRGFFAPRFRDIANYLSQGFSLDEIVGKLNEIKGGKIDDSEMGIITAFKKTPNSKLGDELNADMSSSFRRGNHGLKSMEDVIEERVKYAKVWLENYAPGEFRFEMTDKIPEEANKLTEEQKKYLKEIIKIFNDEETAESLQISLYELSKKLEIPAKDAFAAIYISFIGKSHGPRAGILLSKFGREKVIKRITEVIK